MAENSNIEWTDHTFNPWEGCTKVSPGCDNCYAEARDRRFTGGALWGPHAPRRRTSAANWRKPLAWNRKAEAEGRRYRVFCASLADVFDNHASIRPEWRADLWDQIAATPHLDWLLLTKRPQNIRRFLPTNWLQRPADNIWLGCTITSREEMLRDGPDLARIDALVRFWSVEPLLGDLGDVPSDLMPDLVIVGGESGPGARPMHPDWARSLRDQCVAAGVPFFFKQWGEWAPIETSEGRRAAGVKSSTPRAQWHHAAGLILDTATAEDSLSFFSEGRVFRVGKRAAGRLLDGRTWDQLPEVRHD